MQTLALTFIVYLLNMYCYLCMRMSSQLINDTTFHEHFASRPCGSRLLPRWSELNNDASLPAHPLVAVDTRSSSASPWCAARMRRTLLTIRVGIFSLVASRSLVMSVDHACTQPLRQESDSKAWYVLAEPRHAQTTQLPLAARVRRGHVSV